MAKKNKKKKRKRKNKTVKPKKKNQNLKIKNKNSNSDREESFDSYSIWDTKRQSKLPKNLSQFAINKSKTLELIC
jgi:hypothetical protein